MAYIDEVATSTNPNTFSMAGVYPPKGCVMVSDVPQPIPGSVADGMLVQRGTSLDDAHGEFLVWDGKHAHSADQKAAAQARRDYEQALALAEAKRRADRIKKQPQIERMSELVQGAVDHRGESVADFNRRKADEAAKSQQNSR